MNRMQFGGYLFEQNPRKIELNRTGTLATHALPGAGAITQTLGTRCRVIRCEGEVFANSADEAGTKLSALGNACTAGTRAELYLPTGEHFQAFCARFAYTARGDGRVYTYALEFIESACEGGTV